HILNTNKHTHILTRISADSPVSRNGLRYEMAYIQNIPECTGLSFTCTQASVKKPVPTICPVPTHTHTHTHTHISTSLHTHTSPPHATHTHTHTHQHTHLPHP